MDEGEDLEELLEENARLLEKKAELEKLLAIYEGTPDGKEPVQEEIQETKAGLKIVFDFFNNHQTGELSYPEFLVLAQQLGEEMTEEQFESLNPKTSTPGFINFEDFCQWIMDTSEHVPVLEDKKGKGVVGSDNSCNALTALKLKLRSKTYITTLQAFARETREKLKTKQIDNKVLQVKGNVKIGRFEEPASSVKLNFSNDQLYGKLARDNFPTTPTTAIMSVSFTLNDGVDEFALGELAGYIRDFLLMKKTSLQFSAQKTQLIEDGGEKVVRFSLFYEEIKALDEVRKIILGLAMKEMFVEIESSQQPGNVQDDEFIMLRATINMALAVSFVSYYVDLLGPDSDTASKRAWYIISTLRNADFNLDFDNLEEAYEKFSKNIYEIKEFRGFQSIKALITPLVCDLHQDVSIPNEVKVSYYKAQTLLRGIHSLHFQIDNQIIEVKATNLDIFHILPSLSELQNYRPTPIVRPSPPVPVCPIISSNEFKIAVVGVDGVGKTTNIMKFIPLRRVHKTKISVMGTVVSIELIESSFPPNISSAPPIEPAYQKYKDGIAKTNADGFIIMYSITESESFEAVESIIAMIKEVINDQVPIILASTKNDQQEYRFISGEEGKQLADNYQMSFVELNLDDPNDHIFSLIVAQIIAFREQVNSDTQQWYLG